MLQFYINTLFDGFLDITGQIWGNEEPTFACLKDLRGASFRWSSLRPR